MVRAPRCLNAVFDPAAFEAFPRTPDADAFEALWARDPAAVHANLSHAMYHDAAWVLMLLQRLGAIETHLFRLGERRGDEPAHAVLAAWPDRAVLAFRGSACLRDTLVDFLFLRRRFDGAKVHAGFAHRFDRLWPDIEPRLQDLAVPVSVTGHSLGGAMACLAGTRFAFENVMTFGEPRVGAGLDAIFRAGGHVRIVNGRDPVCRVPLPIGYRHHGDERVVVDPDHGRSATYDHSIVYYGEILELLAAERAPDTEKALAA